MKHGAYIDGFVIPIPKKNKAKYKKMAEDGCATWLKFGALDYKECILDDTTPPGVVMTFRKMAGAKPSEDVWFSFITFKSRKHRDAVNKKVMAFFDEKYKDTPWDMPFDMKRFANGGFKVEVGK